MNFATTSTLSLSLAPYKITVSAIRRSSGNLFFSPLFPASIEAKRHQFCSRECKRVLNSEFSSSNSNRVEIVSAKSYEDEEFVVVNFYRFVYIQNPEDEVSKHLSFLQDRDIYGRVYLNEQGINAQYSGPYKDAVAYISWLKGDDRFSDILVQFSPSFGGHAFPRLKLRYKPSLVQLEGGISHLPLLDLSMRATPLTPAQWRNKLETISKGDETKVNLNTTCILLDVRNGYEWDVGHFRGAERPEVDCFRSTSYGLSESKLSYIIFLTGDVKSILKKLLHQSCSKPARHMQYTLILWPCFNNNPTGACDIDSDPLAHVDKEETDILMYCTGGIRCDVYSAILRQRGFKNLYTLKGGVSHYLGSEGPVDWVGNLFVFDGRLSLPPSSYKGEVVPEERKKQEVSENDSFAKCYICSSQLSTLRHRNCANLDCNLLFLCCAGCRNDLIGCCCLECTSAPRLRPVLVGHQRYKKWHHYRDIEMQSA